MFIRHHQGSGPRAEKPLERSHRHMETLRDLGGSTGLGTARCRCAQERAWWVRLGIGVSVWKHLEATG